MWIEVARDAAKGPTMHRFSHNKEVPYLKCQYQYLCPHQSLAESSL